ncbi:MAG: OsmC family protein [Gemmatimonadetes bacterium]|nr:OsmC family protein [Gemmatimonadota bacterium]
MMTTNLYRARGFNAPGGDAKIETLQATIAFDGSQGMADAVPGPAHLLAGSLAACLLKNVERFHHMLPFAYSAASADVDLERRDAPPAIVRARYVLEVHTDEPASRCALLHQNARKFGTITNTLASACELEGTLRVVRSDGSGEEFPA